MKQGELIWGFRGVNLGNDQSGGEGIDEEEGR